jgi:hypothetical protein
VLSKLAIGLKVAPEKSAKEPNLARVNITDVPSNEPLPKDAPLPKVALSKLATSSKIALLKSAK